MLKTTLLISAWALSAAAGLSACGASDADLMQEVDTAQAPMAGNDVLKSGFVEFCGGPRLPITSGELESKGGAIPNQLTGTYSTDGGDVDLDLKIRINVLKLHRLKVTGGTAEHDGKSVALKASQLAMDLKNNKIQNLSGTLQAADCPKGVVLYLDFEK